MKSDEPGFWLMLGEQIESFLVAPVYRRYVESFGLNGNERVLDFGAGSGRLSRYIARRLLKGGGRLTCVDVSEAWMRSLQKKLRRYPNVDFKLGEITSLGIEDASHDAVVIHFVLHHVEQASRQATIAALARTLKENGKLFIREPTKETHGIPAEEVRQLMRANALEELAFKTGTLRIVGPWGPTLKFCEGVFRKGSTP